jgi:16S rRNA processing protein RimM
LSEARRADDVAVGRIVGAFGLRGEAKVAASDPADIHAGLVFTARLPDGTERALTVLSVRAHKNRLLLHFAGIDGVDEADALRGALLRANVNDLPPLPPDTFRDEELIGMIVSDARLGPLGDVRDVLHYPHADMLVVGERSLLVPMLAAYGVHVDRASATILTQLPPGFEDL